MEVVIGTLVVFGIVTLAMSLGVMLTGRSLRGSCGGPGGADCSCDATARESCDLKRKIAENSSN